MARRYTRAADEDWSVHVPKSTARSAKKSIREEVMHVSIAIARPLRRQRTIERSHTGRIG